LPSPAPSPSPSAALPAEHDLDVKTAKVIEFLREGRQVRVSVSYTLSAWMQEEPARRDVMARVARKVAAAGVGFCDASSIRGEGASLHALFNPAATPRSAAELDRYRTAGEGAAVDRAVRSVWWRRYKQGWLRFSHDFGAMMAGLWLSVLWLVLIGPFSLIARLTEKSATGFIPAGPAQPAAARARELG
jgi:hypothetical protein